MDGSSFKGLQSVPITTNVLSSNPIQPIQHYVIKFINDGGFLQYPLPLKLTTTM
jgi:hypothetical protein